MSWKFWEHWFGSEKAKDNSPVGEGSDNDESVSINQDVVAVEAPGTAAPTVYITENLLERTRVLLASFAEKGGSEGVVYWFGFELGEAAVVTTLVVPDADTSWGCIRTSPQANAQALFAIVGTPLMLLGQAHSHPGSGVKHSPTDDRETFASFEGAISVVVPNYGREQINLETCGIHRHLDGAFQYIETPEIFDHIQVLPGEADFRKKTKTILKKAGN
ncbi:MAG: hypothetical protein M3209_17535 [Acidobacteriota bacterium]|nr:hypothetical protein [Acidobacteriota bacterium]